MSILSTVAKSTAVFTAELLLQRAKKQYDSGNAGREGFISADRCRAAEALLKAQGVDFTPVSGLAAVHEAATSGSERIPVVGDPDYVSAAVPSPSLAAMASSPIPAAPAAPAITAVYATIAPAPEDPPASFAVDAETGNARLRALMDDPAGKANPSTVAFLAYQSAMPVPQALTVLRTMTSTPRAITPPSSTGPSAPDRAAIVAALAGQSSAHQPNPFYEPFISAADRPGGHLLSSSWVTVIDQGNLALRGDVRSTTQEYISVAKRGGHLLSPTQIAIIDKCNMETRANAPRGSSVRS
jgi:hypothetical protein